MKQNRISIYVILFFIIISTVVFVVGLYSTYKYTTTKQEMIEDVKYNSSITLAKLNNNVKDFILSYSTYEYNNLIFNEMNNPNVIAIIVNDYKMAEIIGEKSFYSGKIRDTNSLIVDYISESQTHRELLSTSSYSSELNILDDNGNIIGKMYMYSSDKEINRRLDEIISDNINNMVFLSIFMTIFLFIAIRYFLLNNIFNIIKNIENRDKDGIPVKFLSTDAPKEISNLSSTINGMIEAVRASNTQLSELKERLQLAWDGVNDGIWDWHIQKDEAYFSKNWKKILNYEENELENSPKTFFNLLHEDDRELVKNHLEKHFYNPEHTPYALEVRMKAKDGSYRWVLTRGKASLDENGEPLRMVGSHTDITARKEFERILQEQKEEFETIFNYSKDGLAMLDLESNFLDFNDSYLKMTGFTRKELLTKSCIGLSMPEDKESAKKVMEDTLKYGSVENFEKACVVKDEKVIVTNMSIALLPDKKRVIISAKDVTDKKLIESQSKLASMGEMIGNIAHQWRQPLSAISTVASGIKVKNEFGIIESQDEILNDMDVIIEQTQYLSKTIDDFRNFIREGDKKSDIFISSVIDKTFSILNSTIVNNNINVIINKVDDIKIDGYENELIQALINIINNAKDALKELENDDDKLLFIDTRVIDDDFVLSIKDSGGGIKEDSMDKIFEPYFTTKHKSVGTGIGLSMVYQILTDHHNAKIKAFNESYKYNGKVYRGARFDIVFKID
ncbi:PAS domain S-box protein [Halarcobacter sp.]|uniref:PAS domain S-box protein n=1 Tax=Halarcobacter sp. TaxID=2321133 RepID=UPI003B0055EC